MPQGLIRILTLLTALLLVPAFAHADPVQTALERFNAHADFPLPALDERALADLVAGKVVKIVDRDPDRERPARAIALLLTEHAQEALWVAALDPHLTVDPDLVELRLDDGTGDRELWYGYLDLPMPLSDRHWVVDSWNNRKLAAATGGTAWEHGWRLNTARLPEAVAAVRGGRVAGVDEARMGGAILTPDNHGAWLVVQLPDGRAILGYHATSTIGGSIPDWLVLQLVHSRLDALLERVAARCSGEIGAHYTASHADIEGGDGAALTWRP
jgi:hypothetical protein